MCVIPFIAVNLCVLLHDEFFSPSTFIVITTTLLYNCSKGASQSWHGTSLSRRHRAP